MHLPAPVHSFVSDNASGAHPAVLEAIQAANQGEAAPYGADPWTARATTRIRDLFEAPQAEILFTYGGTGANITALQSMLEPYEAVICPATAHINTDECGSAERLIGTKLIDVETVDGKLTPDLVAPHLRTPNGEHNVQPAVIAISQVTELGTVYTPDEIAALADVAHANGLLLFVDGARLSNAIAHLDCSLAEMADGVDLLTLGGTKNGLLYGEAVVLLRTDRTRRARFARKQTGQLASKMRFIAAQFDALLTDDLWLRNARNANDMATRLTSALADIPTIDVLRDPQANSVFAQLPAEIIAPLQDWSSFLTWGSKTDVVRWMTSFATTADDVDRFVAGVNHYASMRFSSSS